MQGSTYSLQGAHHETERANYVPKLDTEAMLTAMENLMLEVLIARYRLGHESWSFDPTMAKQVSTLAKKGYVKELSRKRGEYLHVKLTDEAIAFELGHDYVPPIAKDNPALADAFRAVTERINSSTQDNQPEKEDKPEKKKAKTSDKASVKAEPS